MPSKVKSNVSAALPESLGSTQRPSIDALRKTINGIFDFIEKDLGITEVELKQNFYWSVNDDALYSMDQPPKELAVGSLVDDWEFVSSAFKSADQQLPIMFIHIVPLLQALSQGVPNYSSPSESAGDLKHGS